MTVHGRKTKIGCAVMVIAAILRAFALPGGEALFMLGVALAFFGLYDRRQRDIHELRQRTKKPMLRNGL
jgi:hypothetical protein